MVAVCVSLLSALLMVPGQAGDIYLYGFIGYGLSSIEESFYVYDGSTLTYVETENGSYVPAGAQFFYQISQKFQIGAEYELCLSDFSGDYTWYDYGSGPGEWEISMNTLGAVARVLLREDIYLRGGVANYSGNLKFEDYYTVGKWDFKSGVGFNFGAGYITMLSESVYGGIEGIYHMVSLEPDVLGDADELQMDHYALRVMIGTSL